MSADKCKSIDLNQVSSATSTPINCKAMNCSKDLTSNSKIEKAVTNSTTTAVSRDMNKLEESSSKQSRLQKRSYQLTENSPVKQS